MGDDVPLWKHLVVQNSKKKKKMLFKKLIMHNTSETQESAYR